MSFQFDRAQGEPSLGAGLDVAQEHEDGGERTDWQVRGKICIKLIKNTKIQEQWGIHINFDKVASFNFCVSFIADHALSIVDQLCKGRLPDQECFENSCIAFWVVHSC